MSGKIGSRRTFSLRLIVFFNVIVLVVISQLTYGISANEQTAAPQEKYFIHFLNEPEVSRLQIHKCCEDGYILDLEGNCIKQHFEPHELGKMHLKSRIMRSIENQNQQPNDHRVHEANQLLFSFTVGQPECQSGLHKLYFNTSSFLKELHFTPTLQFVTKNEDKESNSYLMIDSGHYCIDWLSLDKIAVLFCIPNSCHFPPDQNNFKALDPNRKHSEGFTGIHSGIFQSHEEPLCLLKCCPPSKVLNLEDFSCLEHPTAWQLYSNRDKSSKMKMKRNTITTADLSRNLSDHISDVDDEGKSHATPLDVTWWTGTPDCVSSYEVYADKYDSYYINSDGLLITEQNGTISSTPPGEYCFDAVLNEGENGDLKDVAIFRQVAIVCFEETDGAAAGNGDGMSEKVEVFSNWRMLYTVLTGTSCVFLLLTCLVYVILRKELNLPGWLQFAYAFSLLLTFTLLTVAQLWTQQIHDISKTLCKALGYGLHFFFLSSFFWLLSMNLDLFLKFRNTVLVRGIGKSRGKRRFYEFAALSIGFPAVITLLLAAVDRNCRSMGDNATSKEFFYCILPSSGIGEKSCVVDSRNKVAQLHYFYGFVGILLLINLVIFVATLISLRNRERETRLAKRQSTSNCDYDRLQLFTRLFLIMGVLWIFEVISWIFEYYYENENVYEIFILTDCLNASQGIAVFLMFIWKRQTWKQLKKKLKGIAGRHTRRPLNNRPSFNCTVSSGNHTKETSVKSSHLSSTKSTESNTTTNQHPSTSTTFSQLELDH